VRDANCYKPVEAGAALAKKSEQAHADRLPHRHRLRLAPRRPELRPREPLGRDNLAATKKALGWPCEEPFCVPEEVYA
jgi:hypothetical protein